ncbi:MAG: phosphoglycerate mutase family protein, partial [Chloroflexota bacterium]
MRLYFVRHGQSTNNVLGTSDLNQEEINLQRHHDPELTEIGVQQAQRVGSFLEDGIDMPEP